MEGRESLSGIYTIMLMIKAESKRRGLQRHGAEAITWMETSSSAGTAERIPCRSNRGCLAFYYDEMPLIMETLCIYKALYTSKSSQPLIYFS